MRATTARRSAGIRRRASAILACTNTKARTASPGRARSPGCCSPAASTISSAREEVPADELQLSAQERGSSTRCMASVSTIPARLTGYGETWDGDECVLWAEGIVQQSAVFGEDLHLDPPHRGRCRRQGDPHQRPRGQSRLLPYTAHVFLSRQCRPSAAGRRVALRRADPGRRLGFACRRGIRGSRASAIGRSGGSAATASGNRSGSTRWQPTREAGAGGARQRQAGARVSKL